MAVSSGKYRHRIKIYKTAKIRDEFGGSTNQRTLVANPWCKLRVLADVEYANLTTVAQTRIEFEVRYSSLIDNPTDDMWISFKNEEYDIISTINVNEINEKLLIVGKQRGV